MRRMKYTQFATVIGSESVKILELGDIIEETIVYEDMEMEETTMDAITIEAKQVKEANQAAERLILSVCPVGHVAKVSMQRLVS